MKSYTTYKWKRAIEKSGLPSTTRAILKTLADVMKPDGSGCHLTISQIAEKTGFNRSTVIRHLKKIKDTWVRVFQHKHYGQDWKNHSYQPINPNKSQQKGGCTDVPANPSRKAVAQSDTSVISKATKSPPLSEYQRPAGEMMVEGRVYRVPTVNPKTKQQWSSPTQLAAAMFGPRIAEFFAPAGMAVCRENVT